jgi:hypothetical protein
MTRALTCQRDKNGTRTFPRLTTTPDAEMAELHGRMSVRGDASVLREQASITVVGSV